MEMRGRNRKSGGELPPEGKMKTGSWSEKSRFVLLSLTLAAHLLGSSFGTKTRTAYPNNKRRP